MIIIVMGIAGSGKTTISRMLAEKLQWSFHDADDFHTLESVAKMRNGFPLDDEDRLPWLESLHSLMVLWENQGNTVLACSALKESYRKILNHNIDAQWVMLTGTREVIQQRIKQRTGHFMKSLMVQSQLDILEVPDYAIKVDINQSPESIVNTIIEKLNL